MKRQILLWGLALLVTLASAAYQKKTGPSYALYGNVTLGGQAFPYELERTHGGLDDHSVVVPVPDSTFGGILEYRRYGSSEPFAVVSMTRQDGVLTGALPHQPPAGKLEYYVRLERGDERVPIPADHTAIIRFKGDVPLAVLLPHILLMFMAMLLSTRAGIEALSPAGKTAGLVLWTTITLLLGGMILGPIVQKYAFGQFWTGVPFGWDLTDNKTLIASLGWVAVLIRQRRQSFPRYWILAAAILLLIIFLIPHSVLGSRLDYATGQVTTG